MMQTFDFMWKSYKHVLIQKVTFSTKKNSWHSLTQENPLPTHKNLCVHQSNNVAFAHQFPWVHRDWLFSVHTDCVSHLQQSSLDWLNYLVYSQTFLCWHRVFLCRLVWQEFFSWENYFLDKNTFTSSYWFVSVKDCNAFHQRLTQFMTYFPYILIWYNELAWVIMQFSAMPNLCLRYFCIWTCTYVESTCFLEPVWIAKVSKKTL